MPGRYATALFELAQSAGAVDQVGSALEQFESLLEQSADLVRLVRSPVFSAEDQINALDAVMRRAGISGLAANFIKLVARNRRLFAVAEMIAGYRALVAAERGEVSAEVTAAQALSPAHTARIKAALAKAQGREVQLVTRVDPSILGGLIIKVGSRMVDNSLRTKLLNLKSSMKGA